MLAPQGKLWCVHISPGWVRRTLPWAPHKTPLGCYPSTYNTIIHLFGYVFVWWLGAASSLLIHFVYTVSNAQGMLINIS